MAQAIDESSLERHFGGGDDLLPLWIAEPYLPLAAGVRDSLTTRARVGWYGYETRPESLIDSFWLWMAKRHGWDRLDERTLVSPSVGTSIGVLVEQLTQPGDGVLLQPPVFTDFKPLVVSANRVVVRSPLELTEHGYRVDFEDLTAKVSQPTTKAMVLCNPHNPVGRVWSHDELHRMATVCSDHDVFVIADEIHADLVLGSHRFTPFASAAADTGVRWAALHGPIKTFGLAGVCDTLVITNDTAAAELFESKSSRLHLSRNNVFGLAAFESAYATGSGWLDDLLELVATNASLLKDHLPDEVGLVDLEGTYLAWLDFRRLGLEAPDLARWLAGSARLALSPGHWFGREGAGFARMTIAVPTAQIERAVDRLERALEGSTYRSRAQFA